MKKYRYENCEVTSIYDGDTLTVSVDLGFKIYTTITIRLARINAPEIRGEEKQKGLEAKRYLAERIVGLNERITIETFKDSKEKYGRYLADIFDVDGKCINDELVLGGHAVYQVY